MREDRCRLVFEEADDALPEDGAVAVGALRGIDVAEADGDRRKKLLGDGELGGAVGTGAEEVGASVLNLAFDAV
jgi:hypothetical protein